MSRRGRGKKRSGRSKAEQKTMDPVTEAMADMAMKEVIEGQMREAFMKDPEAFGKMCGMPKGSDERLEIKKRWTAAAVYDRVEAALKKEKELEVIRIRPNFIWSQFWTMPPFLLPNGEKDAGIINDLLVKSWETQGSSCPSLPKLFKPDDILTDIFPDKIHGLMHYYFKCIPGKFCKKSQKFMENTYGKQNLTITEITTKIERIVGLLDYHNGEVTHHIYLKIGDQNIEIDNAFALYHMNYFNAKRDDGLTFMMAKSNLTFRDEDPGTTRRHYAYIPDEVRLQKGREIALTKLRLVIGRDEKSEQKLAYENSCAFNERRIIYDIEMRKYIKEKYGVEIPTLTEKWSKLCWNCFEAKAELKKCSVCTIAQYCSKECQKKDWKIHKEIHGFEDYLKRYELMSP